MRLSLGYALNIIAIAVKDIFTLILQLKRQWLLLIQQTLKFAAKTSGKYGKEKCIFGESYTLLLRRKITQVSGDCAYDRHLRNEAVKALKNNQLVQCKLYTYSVLERLPSFGILLNMLKLGSRQK